MIKVGQKVRIRHFYRDDYEEGIVKVVHTSHQWFSVRPLAPECNWLTSFKFDEIGKTVFIVKG